MSDFWSRRKSLISDCYLFPNFSICQYCWLCCLRLWFLYINTGWISSTQLAQLGGVVDLESYYVPKQGGPGRTLSQIKTQRSRDSKCLAWARTHISLLYLFTDLHQIWPLFYSKYSLSVTLDCEIDSKHHRIFHIFHLGDWWEYVHISPPKPQVLIYQGSFSHLVVIWKSF